MADEEAGLIAAIVAAPDDDAPRLVYADWLQQRDDPRGELIQLQCKLAADPDDDRRRAIKIAENKLLEAHEKTWTRPLHDALPAPQLYHTYKFQHVRGFIEEATITLSALPHLAELFARAPMIRDLTIFADQEIKPAGMKAPRLDGRLDQPEIAKLRALGIGMGAGGNRVAIEVAGMPHLRDLRELRISASIRGEMESWYERTGESLQLDDAGALALASSPHLDRLTSLKLRDNFLTGKGVAALGAARWRLTTLDLSDNLELRGEELVEALHGPAFQDLEVLHIERIDLSRCAGDLAAHPNLRKLRALNLESCRLGGHGMESFCGWLNLPLEWLRVERNSLGDAGAEALAECEALAGLRVLEAGHNRMGKKGGAALASSPHLAGLVRLTLNEPRWTDETKALFGASPTLANAKIYLGGRLVGRQTAKAKKSKVDVQVAAEPKPTVDNKAKVKVEKTKVGKKAKVEPKAPRK
jgi:uncharacterized protein (TIGR02996 family)